MQPQRRVLIFIDLSTVRSRRKLATYLDKLAKLTKQYKIPLTVALDPEVCRHIENLSRYLDEQLDVVLTLPNLANINLLKFNELLRISDKLYELALEYFGREVTAISLLNQIYVDFEKLKVLTSSGFRTAILRYESYYNIVHHIRRHRILRLRHELGCSTLVFAQKYSKYIPKVEGIIPLYISPNEFLNSLGEVIKVREFTIHLRDAILLVDMEVSLANLGSSLFPSDLVSFDYIPRELIHELEFLRIKCTPKIVHVKCSDIVAGIVRKLCKYVSTREYLIPCRKYSHMLRSKCFTAECVFEDNLPYIVPIRIVPIHHQIKFENLVVKVDNHFGGDVLRVEKLGEKSIALSYALIPKRRGKHRICVAYGDSSRSICDAEAHALKDWIFTNTSEVRFSGAGLPLSIKAGTVFIDFGTDACTTVLEYDGAKRSESDTSIADIRFGTSTKRLSAWYLRRGGVGNSFVETEVRIYTGIPVIEIVKKINLFTELIGRLYALTFPLPQITMEIIRSGYPNISAIKISSVEALIPIENWIAYDVGYGYLVIAADPYTMPVYHAYIDRSKNLVALGIEIGTFDKPLSGVRTYRFFIMTVPTLTDVPRVINDLLQIPVLRPRPRAGVIDLYIGSELSIV